MGVGEPRQVDDFPFRSVRNALRIGYTAEANQLCQRSAMFSMYQPPAGEIYGEAQQSPTAYWERATALDRAADAGKVVGLVRRVLRGDLCHVIEAYYLPNDKAQLRVVFEKQSHCANLIPVVSSRLTNPPEYKHVAACISNWAKLHEKPADTVRELEINERTARRLHTANSGYPRQIEEILNEMLDEGCRRLGWPMREYGLIP